MTVVITVLQKQLFISATILKRQIYQVYQVYHMYQIGPVQCIKLLYSKNGQNRRAAPQQHSTMSSAGTEWVADMRRHLP